MTRMPKLSISQIEKLLYKHDIIREVDVPLIIAAFYDEFGVKVPDRIDREVKASIEAIDCGDY